MLLPIGLSVTIVRRLSRDYQTRLVPAAEPRQDQYSATLSFNREVKLWKHGINSTRVALEWQQWRQLLGRLQGYSGFVMIPGSFDVIQS